jgi:hypothetical protein
MGSIQHHVCSTPPDIAVERDLEGGDNAALNLQFIEVLDASPRGLNLILFIVRLEKFKN